MSPSRLAPAPPDSLRTTRLAGVGLVLALSLATPGFVASVMLAVRLPLSPFVLLFTTAAVAGWTWRRDRAGAPVQLALAAVIVVVALIVAAQFFDLSFDGQTYHQVAVRELARGWNPVWNPGAVDSLPGGLYVGSLPKGAWLLEALLFRATGSLESAKGVHLVALAAAFLLAWPALESVGVRRRAAVTVAALAAMNPVALTQLLSFYVDGLVASSLVIVVALALLYWSTGERRWAIALVFMSAFLANLKFPALLYAVLTAAAFVGVVLRADRRRLRSAGGVLLAAGAMALVEGINPLVTNSVRHGHPAFPALGPHAIPNVVHFDPVFAAQPRIVQLLRALASRSSNDDSLPPRLKVPFTVHASEVAAFATVDTRIGGLGPLFGGALALAWIVLGASCVARVARAPGLALLSLAVVGSALAIPDGYYSRYAPQLWLACLPALLIDEVRGRSSRLLALVLAANLVMVATISLGSQLVVERLHRAQLRDLAAAAGGGAITVAFVDAPFVNVDRHFGAYGLHYRMVDSLACATPARLLKTHAMICLPGNRSPAAEPDAARLAEPILSALGLR